MTPPIAMTLLTVVLGAVVQVTALASASAGSDETMATVVSTRSYWTAGRRTIMTESVLDTATGPLTVVQRGGTVDGIHVQVFPSPPVLAPGMEVAVTVRDVAPATNRSAAATLVRRGQLMSARVLSRASSEAAFSQTVNDNQKPVYWRTGCLTLTIDSAGTRALPGDLEREVVRRAMATWNDAVASCSYTRILEDEPRPVEENATDRVNVLTFHDDPCAPCAGLGGRGWCDRSQDPDDLEQYCFPSEAYAVTQVSSLAETGEIVDADISFNGVDYAIAVDGTSLARDQACLADLQALLTHELGHALGLSHSCDNGEYAGKDQRDHLGNPLVSCGEAFGTAVQETTMYPNAGCGDTFMATLAADDIAAICSVYAAADDGDNVCHAPRALNGYYDDGCLAGPGGAGVIALVAASLFVVGAGRRRRVSPR